MILDESVGAVCCAHAAIYIQCNHLTLSPAAWIISVGVHPIQAFHLGDCFTTFSTSVVSTSCSSVLAL